MIDRQTLQEFAEFEGMVATLKLVEEIDAVANATE